MGLAITHPKRLRWTQKHTGFFNGLQSPPYSICILVFSFLDVVSLLALLVGGVGGGREREKGFAESFLPSWRVRHVPNPFSPLLCHSILGASAGASTPRHRLHPWVLRALGGVWCALPIHWLPAPGGGSTLSVSGAQYSVGY